MHIREVATLRGVRITRHQHNMLAQLAQAYVDGADLAYAVREVLDSFALDWREAKP